MPTLVESVTKKCLFCGTEFTTVRAWTKYCPGTDHQQRMWLAARRRASALLREESLSQ